MKALSPSTTLLMATTPFLQKKMEEEAIASIS
jgi:hypothetical protein